MELGDKRNWYNHPVDRIFAAVAAILHEQYIGILNTSKSFFVNCHS